MSRIFSTVYYGEKCSVLTCFYNNNGLCCSVSDLHNPELKEDCVDYIEKGEYIDKEIKFILSTYKDDDIEYSGIEVAVGDKLIQGIHCDTLQEAIKQFDQWQLNMIERGNK